MTTDDGVRRRALTLMSSSGEGERKGECEREYAGEREREREREQGSARRSSAACISREMELMLC
jgi:hypothetical protein